MKWKLANHQQFIGEATCTQGKALKPMNKMPDMVVEVSCFGGCVFFFLDLLNSHH